MANKTIKILAVDDHIDNLVVLKALVYDSFPAAVFIAADSGRKGFELCQSENPDVILLDIVMPGMDGYEVCKKIKSDLRLKHIPVVMVTANRSDKESRVKALESGADAFLPKPVDESELIAQIKAMLRIKESEDLKKEEKQRLENMVLDRTEALENELADRKKAENKLIQSLDKITKNRQAIMNLMEDLKIEIGERKLAEENLQNERNLLRTLIDNLPETIYIMDKEGRKVIANRADLRTIGFDKEVDVIGKTDLDLFPGEVGMRCHSDNMAVINSANPIVDLEEFFISSDGKKKWLLTSKYPLFDSGGNVKGLFGTGHDITNRKVAEQELETKNRELSFLNTLAFEIAQLSLTDNINLFLARKIKEFSEASIVVSLDYIPEKKALQIKHIETNQDVINKISNSLGIKFFETLIPVPDENLEFVLKEYFVITNSLSELSFGQLSDNVDKVIKEATNIDRFYAIANVIGGKYLGTTMLGFKEGTVAPRKEVLVAFARVAATTIQNRISEEKLKAREEQFRLLIENQGEGVGIVDLAERFVFVNPAAEEMFGLEKGGLLYRNLMDFVKPEQKAVVNRETLKRANAEKSSYEIDIIRPNGEQRTLIITATPQFTNEGILSGTFGVFRDITERKQMEQKIIESETYYRTLIDISPDGILIADLEGNVTYGSIKALEIFGVPPGEDIAGTSILRWLAPDSQSTILERFLEIMKRNVAPETSEYELVKFDGSTFWGEISSSPISDKEGNPSSLIIECRDISDRKKFEYELIKSKEKAEESDRLKTAFLHNISHEIRTPMNAIIGFSALLSEPDLDKESMTSFVEIITNSSNQLLSIVTDIIEISNIEAGNLKLNIINTNLNRVSGNLQNRFSPVASEKNVGFIIDPGLKDGEAQIWTDETKLSQILSSLLSNAFKFTTKGSITLGYKLKGNFIEFFVSDTGIGIPKDEFRNIFERFYQVEHTLDRQYDGTGLGLSIAKAYVELLGGKIWLISEPGSGTTFLFTIPYSSAEPTPNEENNTGITGEVKKNENKTVLIAEDEADNYRLFVHFLSGLNLKLIHAENGKVAVAICDSNEQIDLVLMDIKMPVMDGLEATTLLKKRRPSLPVIAQTAFAFECDRDKVFKAGCDDYIAKPIKKDILIAMVKKYL